MFNINETVAISLEEKKKNIKKNFFIVIYLQKIRMIFAIENNIETPEH